MKNLKKLTAVLLTVAMITAMALVPAFAEGTSTISADATICKDLGVLQGENGVTADYLAKTTLRYQAAIMYLRLLGLEDDALAGTYTENFKDASKVNSDNQKILGYLKAHPELGFVGDTVANTFDPLSPTTVQMIDKVMLVALGYKEDTDFTYAKAVSFAAGKGLVKLLDKSAITNDDFATALVEALKTATNGATTTLTKKLIDTKVITEAAAVAAGLATATPPPALAVDSISATNNKEVVLTFNNDLDETSAETVGNYTLSAGGPATAAVMNGKTVTLTLTTAQAQQASIDVTVKNVKGADGKAIADTTKSVKFFDAVVPTVASAEVTGPKDIKVTFSEPITSTAIGTTANFVIDSGTYSVSTVTASGTKAVVVSLGSSLPAGAHKITVNNVGTNADPGIKDYANFYVAKATVDFNYAVDSAAPSVTLVSAKQNEVKIKFSKPITTNRGQLVVYHTYKNATYDQDSTTWDTDNQTVTLAYNNAYLPVGSATIYVQNADTVAANQLKDAWGNAFVNTTLTADISTDTTAPTITGVTAVTATSIEVTFSEAVTGATVASNFALKDTDNSSIAVISSVLKAGTTSTYTLTTGQMNGGSYTLTVKGIKDTSVAQNAMVDFSGTVSVNDLVKPTVTGTGVYSSDKKAIVVKFSEAMATTGTASILSLANYQIANDGTNFVDLSSITGAAVVAGPGNKSVTISFPASRTGLSNGVSKVKVARVSDVAGNVTASLASDVTLSLDDITNANTSNVKLISKNSVTFEVDTTLSAIDVTKFNIDNGGDRAATAASYVNQDNKALVTVTTATNLATDASDLVNVEFTAGGLTTSLGTSNTGTVTEAKTTSDAADYCAPALVSTTTVDADHDGHLDAIDVVYSESLYAASVNESDYTVEGYEITGVVAAGTTVRVYVKELAGFDTGVTPKVTLVGGIADASTQRNSFGAQAAVTSADGAAPVLVAWSMDMNSNGDSKAIVLTFSENVTTANMDATKLDIQGASGAYAAGDFTAGTKTQTASNVITLNALGAAMVGTINGLDAINDAASVYYMATGAALATDGTNPSTAATGILAASFTADTTAAKITGAVGSANPLVAGSTITITYDDYMTTSADVAANYTETSAAASLANGTATADATGDIDTAAGAFVAGEKVTASATVVDIAGNAVDTSNDTIACPADATTAWTVSAN